MQNYFVTILELSLAAMYKVTASSQREAKIIALAYFNMVSVDDIDLDCTGDMTIVCVAEDRLEDLTA